MTPTNPSQHITHGLSAKANFCRNSAMTESLGAKIEDRLENLSCHLGGVSSQYVLSMSHRFKMIWSDACSHTAQVIQFFAFWNGAVLLRPHRNMRKRFLPAHRDFPMPELIAKTVRPDPTWRTMPTILHGVVSLTEKSPYRVVSNAVASRSKHRLTTTAFAVARKSSLLSSWESGAMSKHESLRFSAYSSQAAVSALGERRWLSASTFAKNIHLTEQSTPARHMQFARREGV